MLTLVRQPGPLPAVPVTGIVLRPPSKDDAAVLGRLYFEAYEPGVAAATAEEALADIRLSFEGGYGVLDPNLSRLAWAENELVGAMLVVERAPWPDTPDCPFIIELFTARAYRRRGIGRLLLAGCSDVPVALRVDAYNAAALMLYRSVGFQVG